MALAKSGGTVFDLNSTGRSTVFFFPPEGPVGVEKI